MTAPGRDFVFQLTDWQRRLLGYLFTLLGDLNAAHDVLQETNLVLWRKRGEFPGVENFGAWARKCAYYQALAFLRDRKRDRHLFDNDLLDLLGGEAGQSEHDDDELRLILRDCLAQLPDRQRQLIARRYQDDVSIGRLAADAGKTESAIKMMLMRIREALRMCIEMKLREA